MFDRDAVSHDLDIIVHLAGRLDMDDREQIRAVLLMQKKDNLLVSDYGKKFIGRLIGVFTGRDVPRTDIFTGDIIQGKFPVDEFTIERIKSNPDGFVAFLEKKDAADALARHRREAASAVERLKSTDKNSNTGRAVSDKRVKDAVIKPTPKKSIEKVEAEEKAVTPTEKRPQMTETEVKEKTRTAAPPRTTEDRADTDKIKQEKDSSTVKPSFYQQQEMQYRRKMEEARIADEQRIQEQAELRAAQEALDKEAAQYDAIKDTAKKAKEAARDAFHSAKDTAEDLSNRVYEFSKASGREGNSPLDLFADIEKPWKYLNIYWKLFLVFLLFGYWFIMTKSAGAIVPEMILGSAMIPVAVILYLNEINGIYEETLPLTSAVYSLIFGGIMSLILTWITGVVFIGVPVLNAVFAGIIDELMVFVTLLGIEMYHIKRTGKNATVLQGAWYGACFGAGFSIYQVCQTSLSGYLSDGRAGVFMWKLLSQSLLSLGGHIAWALICGGALSVIVTETGVIKSYEFGKMCALSVAFPIIMQVLWDLPFGNWGIYGFTLKGVALGLISLWVVNIFLHRGIREAIISKRESI